MEKQLNEQKLRTHSSIVWWIDWPDNSDTTGPALEKPKEVSGYESE